MLPFERRFECGEEETLLAAALRQGLYLRYGCKNGGCGTCKARLTAGSVDQREGVLALSSAEQVDGWALLCTAVPLEDCVIDVESMAMSEEEFLAGDQPGVFTSEVERLTPLTPTVHELRLRLLEPATIRFTAGQFIGVEAPDSRVVRSFSIASPPSAAGHIDLLIRVYPDGAFSRALATSIRPGTRLRLLGPFGQLRVRLSHRPIVMLAAGTGIAPFLSMLAGLAEQGNTRPVTLFFGVSGEADLFALDRLGALQAAMPALEFVPTLSTTWPADWKGATGRVTDVVRGRYRSLEDHDAYLCGPRGLIEAGLPLLRDLGVRPRNIYYEAFVPTGGTGESRQ